MKLSDLADGLDPKWKGAFRHFVATGEADDAFLTYLDSSPEGQQVVERAFNAQAAAFERFAEELRQAGPDAAAETAAPVETPAVPPARPAPPADLSEQLARTVNAVSELPPEERHRVTARASTLLHHDDVAGRVHEVLAALDATVSDAWAACPAGAFGRESVAFCVSAPAASGPSLPPVSDAQAAEGAQATARQPHKKP